MSSDLSGSKVIPSVEPQLSASCNKSDRHLLLVAREEEMASRPTSSADDDDDDDIDFRLFGPPEGY